MTRLGRWLDQLTDPSGREHLTDDAMQALRLLVAMCLVAIVCVVAIAVSVWSALPAGEPEQAPATVQP